MEFINVIDRKKKALHARGELLGVHIGVYQAYYNVKRTLDPTWLG